MCAQYSAHAFNSLCEKLRSFHYTQRLTIDSAPLVEKLLNDVLKAVENFQTLAQKYDQLIKQSGTSQPFKAESLSFPHQNLLATLPASSLGSTKPSTCSQISSPNSACDQDHGDYNLTQHTVQSDEEQKRLYSLENDLECANRDLLSHKKQLAEKSRLLSLTLTENQQLLSELQALKRSSLSNKSNSPIKTRLQDDNPVYTRLSQPETQDFSCQVDSLSDTLSDSNERIAKLEENLRVERNRLRRKSKELLDMQLLLRKKEDALDQANTMQQQLRSRQRTSRSLSPPGSAAMSPKFGTALKRSSAVEPSFRETHRDQEVSVLPSLLSNYFSTVSPFYVPGTASRTPSVTCGSARSKSPKKHDLHSGLSKSLNCVKSSAIDTHDLLHRQTTDIPSSATVPFAGLGSTLAEDYSMKSKIPPDFSQSLYALNGDKFDPFSQQIMLEYLSQLKNTGNLYEETINQLKRQLSQKEHEMEQQSQQLEVFKCRIALLGRTIAQISQSADEKRQSYARDVENLRANLTTCERSINHLQSLVTKSQYDLHLKVDENRRLVAEIKSLHAQLEALKKATQSHDAHQCQASDMEAPTKKSPSQTLDIDTHLIHQPPSQTNGSRPEQLMSTQNATQNQTHHPPVQTPGLQEKQTDTQSSKHDETKFESNRKKHKSKKRRPLCTTQHTQLFQLTASTCPMLTIQKNAHFMIPLSTAEAESAKPAPFSQESTCDGNSTPSTVALESRIQYLETQLRGMSTKLSQQRCAFNALQNLCTTLKCQLTRQLKSASPVTSVNNLTSLLTNSLESSGVTRHTCEITPSLAMGSEDTSSTLLNNSFNRQPVNFELTGTSYSNESCGLKLLTADPVGTNNFFDTAQSCFITPQPFYVSPERASKPA